MTTLDFALTVLSNLLRFFVYAFLRVIPSKLLIYAIAPTYVLYAVLYLLIGAPPAEKSIGVTTATSHVDLSESDVVDEKKIEFVENDATLIVRTETTVEVSAEAKCTDRAKILLFSLPTRNRTLRLANLLLNTGLVLLVLDFSAFPLLHPAKDVVFARLGAVEPDAVKIAVRYPNPLREENVTSAAVKVAYRQLTSSAPLAWKYSLPIELAEDNDWVNTIKISGLWPTTAYEYTLTMANNTILPYPSAPLRFHTAPDFRLQHGSHFRFIASSCITPNFPYVPFQGNSLKGFDLLAHYLWPAGLPGRSPTTAGSPTPSSQTHGGVTYGSNDTSTAVEATNASSSPAEESVSHVPVVVEASDTVSAAVPSAEFMLFLGDFIYADVPFYWGDDQEAYRRLYRRNYGSESFRKVYENLPIYHIYDDHEFVNNYAGESNDSKPPFANASSAFQLYNGAANYDALVKGENYYDFRYGDVAFFVMDTRRHRTDVKTGEAVTQSMLGESQMAALYNWLGKVNQTATFKFVVSSVPFTSLWTHEAEFDSWAGYPVEKAALLQAFHSVPNVIVISGDRHEFAAIEFNSANAGHHQVHEISTSPLSMFYMPFIRTLQPESKERISKRLSRAVTLENGTEVIEDFEEEVPTERVQKYIATGNHKWSTLEVDTRDPDIPVVHLEVVVDGKIAYKHDILGTPVKLRLSTSLGTLLPHGFKGVLDKIGLAPSKWF